MTDSFRAAVLDALPQSALDLLPAALFFTSVPAGVILRCNHRALELLGPLRAERLRDLLRSTEGAADRIDPLATALEGAVPLRDAEGILETAGGPLPVSISIQPLPDPAGRVAAALTVCQPIARWKETERSLRRSEQWLMHALSAGRLGAWEFNLVTRVLTASDQCKANHGLPPDADLQLEADLLPSIDAPYREPFSTAIDNAIATHGSFEIEVPLQWPDGSPHWLLVAGRVIDPGSMVGVSLDVTARRRIEQELRESERRKEEFLTMLAHELRNPLAAIFTAVRLLQLKGPPDPDLQRLRETVGRQTTQLTALVDDLLDVGRITAGKLQLNRTRVDVNALLRQAVETCAPAIERRKHTLTVGFAAEAVRLDADASRIVQVICNLLNNAAKYSREGSRIELSAVAAGREVVITVRDEGVGIARDMLERIFDRYVQVRSSQYRAEGGLGIGLSLVKALVELHDGQVEARSEGVGKGSEFVVRLPAAE